jgi:hypothetical protein
MIVFKTVSVLWQVGVFNLTTSLGIRLVELPLLSTSKDLAMVQKLLLSQPQKPLEIQLAPVLESDILMRKILLQVTA